MIADVARSLLLAPLLAVCLPAVALADDAPPAPDVVLQHASLGRSEFSDVMFQLRAGIPALTTPAALYPYLLILDPLLDIHAELGFSVFDSGLLDNVSQDLTRTAGPMLNLSTDSLPVVQAFSRWAADDLRMPFCLRQQAVIAGVRDRAGLIDLLAKITAGQAQLTRPNPFTNLPSASLAAPDYERLRGLVLVNFIKFLADQLPADEFRQLLTDVRSQDGLVEVVAELHRQTYVQTSAVGLARTVAYALATSERLSGLTPAADSALVAAPGAVVADAAFKLLTVGGALDSATTARATAILTPEQVDGLGARLLGLRLDMVGAPQLAYLGQLAGFVAGQYAAFGMITDQRAMEDLGSRVALIQKLLATKADGVFDIQLGGDAGILTLARTGTASLAVGLSVRGVPFSMTYARYEAASDTIEVDSMAPGESPVDAQHPTANASARLRLSSDGATVSGVFSNAVRTQTFVGVKRSTFVDYLDLPVPSAAPPSPEGTYYGQLFGMVFRLPLRRVGAGFVASLEFDPGGQDINVPFAAVAYDPRNGALYLTSLNPDDAGFIQIRGRLTGTTFQGDYIISDRSYSTPFVARHAGP